MCFWQEGGQEFVDQHGACKVSSHFFSEGVDCLVAKASIRRKKSLKRRLVFDGGTRWMVDGRSWYWGVFTRAITAAIVDNAGIVHYCKRYEEMSTPSGL